MLNFLSHYMKLHLEGKRALLLPKGRGQGCVKGPWPVHQGSLGLNAISRARHPEFADDVGPEMDSLVAGSWALWCREALGK